MRSLILHLRFANPYLGVAFQTLIITGQGFKIVYLKVNFLSTYYFFCFAIDYGCVHIDIAEELTFFFGTLTW